MLARFRNNAKPNPVDGWIAGREDDRAGSRIPGQRAHETRFVMLVARKGDLVAVPTLGDDGMSERHPFAHIILNVEITPIHGHAGLAASDEKAGRVGAVVQENFPVENEVESVRCDG